MFLKGRHAGLALVLGTALLAGCSLTSTSRAPVENRGGPAAGAVDPATLPGAENAGKPGYYTVRPGDTVFSISRASGQSWRDIVRWNDLTDANVIEVGQVLRVEPPAGAVVAGPVTSNPAATAGSGKSAASPPRASQPAPPPPAAGGSIKFAWPAKGSIVSRFEEGKSKGVGIAGKAGDPVRAAADGSVVYAGAGLRGYGNLIIVKHNDLFLTAYAHNQKLLVKEDQRVTQGQVIAEMGSSDADRVMLYFELRRDGNPVDPLPYLPAQ